MVGQTVLVIGDHEHDGIHHLDQACARGFISGFRLDVRSGGKQPRSGKRSAAFRSAISMSLLSLVDHLVARPPEKRQNGGGGPAMRESDSGSARQRDLTDFVYEFGSTTAFWWQPDERDISS